MKARHFVLFNVLAIACCFGAAPESLEGFVYYESGGTIAHTGYRYALVLGTSGSFHGLYGASMIVNTDNFPEDGTWSYRKIDTESGELTLHTTSGSSSVSRNFTLVFTSDSGGFILGATLPSVILGASFQIAPASSRSPLVNCSNRSFVRAGASAFTGFVISGQSIRTVLVRAIGPGLAPFAIADALADPTIIVRSGDKMVDNNNDWGGSDAESIRRTSAFVGAFPLPTGSKDAAIILTLPPGAYIAEVSSSLATDSGQALIEVYMLP